MTFPKLILIALLSIGLIGPQTARGAALSLVETLRAARLEQIRQDPCSLAYQLAFNPIRVPEVRDGNTVSAAKNLVAQLNQRFAPKDPPKAVEPYRDLANAKLVHVFGLEVAPQVLQNGSLSFAEVPSYRNAPHNRLQGDQESLGIQLDLSQAAHRELLPKYAYLVPVDRPQAAGFGESMRMWGHDYGEISAVLKDQTKERAMWQYGNDGKFHAMSEPLVEPSQIEAPHLEGVVLGPIRPADIDYLVFHEVMLDSLQRDIQSIASKKREDSPAYYDSVRKQEENLKKFIETTRVMGIPLFVGKINVHLKPTTPGQETFQLGRSLNGVSIGAPRPALSQQQIADLLKLPPERDWKATMDDVFKKGLSLDEQIKRYQTLQDELRQDLDEEE